MRLSQNLIKHIRDHQEKLIIVDNKGEPQIVLMPYTVYQNYCDNQKNNKTENNNNNLTRLDNSPYLTGLTSDELLDRINKNIAQWKEQQNNPTDLERGYFIKEATENDIDNNINDKDENSFDEDRFYLETINSDL